MHASKHDWSAGRIVLAILPVASCFVMVFGVACGASPSFAFKVVAYIPIADKDTLSVSFDPTLHQTGHDGYRQPYVARTYQTAIPTTGVPRPAITMTASAPGQAAGLATLTPFVCDSMPDFKSRIQQGWSAVESAEALVGTDGSIQLEGSFEFPLEYTCNLNAPGGGEGESAGAINAPTPQLCTEPARQKTDVVLASNAAPSSSRQPTYCYAHHKRQPSDRVELWFVMPPTTPGGDDGFTIFTSHCLGIGETYPLQIAAPIPANNPCGGLEYISLDVGPSGSIQRLEAMSGGWSLDSVDLSLDGLVGGSVDATFMDAQGTTYHATGPVVLPNTMIP